MKINRKSKNQIEIFELAGDLDFHTSPELRKQFHKVLEKETPKILVSLKDVSYIDSSGLATFVEVLQKMKQSNGRLVLYEIQPTVKSVFEIAKLESIFTFSGSESESLKCVADHVPGSAT